MEVPDFRSVTVPEPERQATFLLEMQLVQMPDYCQDLWAAAELLGQATIAERQGAPRELMSAWRMLAARQAIVSTYNYVMATKAARKLLRSARTLSGLVDQPKLERVTDRFTASFPNITQLRQTVLHQSEVTATPERFDENKNRLKEGFGCNGVVSSSMVNNVYTASFAGEQFDYELSHTKARELRGLCSAFFSAFPSAENR